MPAGTPNRLIHTASPYLLQHAHNPVDWYPWGPEALAAARSADKPIFLSVGYSACHWCHVMERESFEDPATASLMNEHFVNIKVDREERPDLDEIYMQAVQLFTGGHGGWPMSVFLTPQLEPFLGGTYFPPADRHGMPSFRAVLHFAADSYRSQRGNVASTAAQVVAALHQMAAVAPARTLPGVAVLDAAYEHFRRSFDTRDGGFGAAPKFPHAMGLAFLLRYHTRSGHAEALSMVTQTLRRMARGGIYDQLGGGFHRYSTDAQWLVPHFEKMLYDNALLARVYAEAFQLTGEPLFRTIAMETLSAMQRELGLPGGGFGAAQDADSEGHEGKYFVWTPAEIEAVVEPAAARLLCAYFDVLPAGNFEDGRSVLAVPREPDEVAAQLGCEPAVLAATVAAGRARLLAARELRVRPGRDDKIVVAWNALAVRAFVAAATAFDDAQALAQAAATARFLLERAPAGPLARTWRGDTMGSPGFLDDHAALVAACLDLYEATFEPAWLAAAQRLADVIRAEFADPDQGGFFYTARGQETLLVRTRQPFDNATPGGNSLHAGNLLRLSALTGDAGTRQEAERTLMALGEMLEKYPSGMAEMLCALDFALGPAIQVAITGAPAAARPLWRAVWESFLPRKVMAGWPEAGPPADIALLAGRDLVDGRPAAYVCREFTCRLPAGSAAELRRALAEAAG